MRFFIVNRDIPTKVGVLSGVVEKESSLRRFLAGGLQILGESLQFASLNTLIGGVRPSEVKRLVKTAYEDGFQRGRAFQEVHTEHEVLETRFTPDTVLIDAMPFEKRCISLGTLTAREVLLLRFGRTA